MKYNKNCQLTYGTNLYIDQHKKLLKLETKFVRKWIFKENFYKPADEYLPLFCK